MAIHVWSEPSQNPGIGKKIGEAAVMVDDGHLRFSFKAARGYNQYSGQEGNTSYTLWPDARSFADIAKAMMEADPDAAIKAFGAALSSGLPANASQAA